jgi:hypothetical protein
MSPEDVIKLSLEEFETAFGFRPKDAQEQKWYAITGKRLSKDTREFLKVFG